MTKPIRLCILNSHPIQYFAPLYQHIDKLPQIDLHVYYCSRQGLDEYIDTGFGKRVKWDIPLLEGYSYKFLQNIRTITSIGGFFSLINPSIVAELRRGSFDALWVNGHNYATTILGIIAAKTLGIPVLMRCETHLRLIRSPFKRMLRRPLMSMLYKFCDACLAIGTQNAAFYYYHGVSRHKVFLVPYTVDNEYFAVNAKTSRSNLKQVKARLGLPINKPIILFASKLTNRKRPLDLLIAYQRICEKQVDASLVFVGDGEQNQMLKRYASEQNLKNVFFLGFRNQSELPEIYGVSDIFVLPSENEPWGLVINEAMAAGLPIIATDEIGAVDDLVQDGYCGFVFSKGDVDTLADRLLQLISNKELRAYMSKNVGDKISSWSYEQSIKGILSAIEYTKRSK